MKKKKAYSSNRQLAIERTESERRANYTISAYRYISNTCEKRASQLDYRISKRGTPSNQGKEAKILGLLDKEGPQIKTNWTKDQ